MTVARCWSVALIGAAGQMIEIEVDLGRGLPRTVLAGLPDASILEAIHRCRAAVANAKLPWPQHLVTVNLSPAALPKTGSHYDLGIATAILGSLGVFPLQSVANLVLVGELGLGGELRGVLGLLPMLLAAKQQNFTRAIVPFSQLPEAKLVPGLEVIGVRNLKELVNYCSNGELPEAGILPNLEPGKSEKTLDFNEVCGQAEAKWALEIAAAGGHHSLLTGPPGVGKTLLAQRLVGILPELSPEAAMEVSAVHSIAGKDLSQGLITRPPFVAPHHSASMVALVGGGSRIPRPGAISLAHRGILFLDEAPEFSAKAIEALRQPLESGEIILHRAIAKVKYPARFMLILSANLCPCGLFGFPECSCNSATIRRYQSRISGPILDRIDIHQKLRPLPKTFLSSEMISESSAVIANRVLAARKSQYQRQGKLNSALSGTELRRKLPLPKGISKLEEQVQRGKISARGVDKVLRLSWSIADLAEKKQPEKTDLEAAIMLRRSV